MSGDYRSSSPSLEADKKYLYAHYGEMIVRNHHANDVLERVPLPVITSAMKRTRDKISLAEICRRFDNQLNYDFASSRDLMLMAALLSLRIWELQQLPL